MSELLTAAQMRAIEEAAIASGEVTGLELMERAGRGVVEAIFEEWPELRESSHRAVVLCGPGNNGGDGFVVARYLQDANWEVTVASARRPEEYTGDAARMDEDGYITIVDRLKDMIVTGGENVFSIEVENAVSSHPAVRECAVFGIPDAKWGELVLGLVVLADNQQATEDELRDHCRSRLAGYKIPKRIEFRTELARTATGKLQKFKLRQPYWEELDRQVN